MARIASGPAGCDPGFDRPCPKLTPGRRCGGHPLPPADRGTGAHPALAAGRATAPPRDTGVGVGPGLDAPARRSPRSADPGEQFVERLLRVAVEHPRVILEEERVLDSRIARALPALGDVDGLG